jgi:hypothetical protein
MRRWRENGIGGADGEERRWVRMQLRRRSMAPRRRRGKRGSPPVMICETERIV